MADIPFVTTLPRFSGIWGRVVVCSLDTQARTLQLFSWRPCRCGLAWNGQCLSQREPCQLSKEDTTGIMPTWYPFSRWSPGVASSR